MWSLNKKKADTSPDKKGNNDTGKTTAKKVSKKASETTDKNKSKDASKTVDKKKSKNANKAVEKENQTTTLTEKEARKILNFNKVKAKELLKDKNKMDTFLSEVNEKFDQVTNIGDRIAEVPIIVSLIRAYIKGEYRKIPLGSLIGLIAALVYFVSPVNMIPDFIPLIGQVDEMMVLGIALKLAYTDLQDYKKWLEENKL